MEERGSTRGVEYYRVLKAYATCFCQTLNLVPIFRRIWFLSWRPGPEIPPQVSNFSNSRKFLFRTIAKKLNRTEIKSKKFRRKSENFGIGRLWRFVGTFFFFVFWWTGVSLQTTSLSRFFGARTNFFSFISKWLIIQQIWICPCLDFLTTLRFCRGKNIQSGAASLSWGIASSLVWRVLPHSTRGVHFYSCVTRVSLLITFCSNLRF